MEGDSPKDFADCIDSSIESKKRPVRTKRMPQKLMDSSYALAGDVFTVEELTSKYNRYVNNTIVYYIYTLFITLLLGLYRRI